MHLGIGVLAGILGTTVDTKYIEGFGTENLDYVSYQNTRHGLSSIQMRDKGLGFLSDYVAKVRDVVVYDIPL